MGQIPFGQKNYPFKFDSILLRSFASMFMKDSGLYFSFPDMSIRLEYQDHEVLLKQVKMY